MLEIPAFSLSFKQNVFFRTACVSPSHGCVFPITIAACIAHIGANSNRFDARHQTVCITGVLQTRLTHNTYRRVAYVFTAGGCGTGYYADFVLPANL